MNIAWAEQRIEQLKTMWAAGHSAREIANELGVTRNAVLGKVHRLDLAGREQYGPKAPRAPRKVREPKPHLKLTANRDRDTSHDEAPVDRIEDLAIPVEQRRQLLELEPCHCRWPVGDPDRDGFFFCGALGCDVDDGRPYCKAHSAVAFTGVPARTKVYAMRRRAA